MHCRPANKVIHICNLFRREKNLVIANMDSQLMSFNTKGKKIWQIKLPTNVTCIEQVDIPGKAKTTFKICNDDEPQSLFTGRGLSLVAVALASNHVLIYDDKNIVDHFKVGVSFFILYMFLLFTKQS